MEATPLALLPLSVFILFGGLSDIIILFLFGLNLRWETVQQFWGQYISSAILINVARTTTLLFTGLQLARYIKGLQAFSTPTDGFPVKPMLFPCRTSHTRMFPTVHSFSYSYLFVGVPVGWKGSVGGLLSEDNIKEQAPWYIRWFSLSPENAWYIVNSDDYLGRGHVDDGLQGKLRIYLENQGVEPSQFSHAYLITAARFLNYASNPVSIWYLYSNTKELAALVLEVNNTFDERHIYFLSPAYDIPDDPSKEIRYTGTWPKDFYVSTFNSRAGSYSLSASDPFFPFMTGPGQINSTITLSSSQGHPKLIARVCTSSAALDPATMTVWDKTKFLSSWWWVGLATFPRTVKEALILLFRRKVAWVFRPEPRKNTMSRHADATELCIERSFRSYLQHLVEGSEKALKVRYIPAGLIPSSITSPILAPEEETIISPSAQLLPDDAEELELRVLTPSFYSRLVQYPDLLDGILSECRDSATICISNSNIVSFLFPPSQSPPGLEPKAPVSFQERVKFHLLSTLRKRPSPIQNLADDPAIITTTTTPIYSPAFPSSSVSSVQLDRHVQTSLPQPQTVEYLSRVLRLLVAQRLALGSPEILTLQIFSFRFAAAWLIAHTVFGDDSAAAL